MNVLSLFDGMSCGRIALERAGISVANYYASEIDRYAIQVSKANWPGIQHLGDIRQVSAARLPKIDLLMGGSPCQGFSFAGKQLNFDDPRSALFFEYIRLKNELAPKWFLLENVVMKPEYEHIISDYMDVDPVMIDSRYFSAQVRKRLYWTNIPIGKFWDKNIFIEGILQDPEQIPVIKSHGELIYKPHKGMCLDANYWKGPDNHGQRTGCVELGHADLNITDIHKRVYDPSGKCPTLIACGGGHNEKKIAVDANHWRKLTPVECERLQTVPDNYTASVSNTQRYKMLGNGWTVDVIAHILRGINSNDQ